jgi:aryl-alcohol dehydrogenase-like predicted oxidoreductase
MRTRPLGNTGIEVSEIGMGGWAIGGNAHGESYGTTEDATSLATLNRAYELGCTLFDTSDRFGHGHSEALIGQALKGWERERVTLVTKGGQDPISVPGTLKLNFSEKYLRTAVEASLQRLGTDIIDVYMLDTPSMELIHLGRMFAVLQALQQEGKIKHYGISIHDPMEGVKAIEVGGVQVIEAPYHLFDRRLEKVLAPTCLEKGVGLIAREPLANGFLAGCFTEGMSFEAGDFRAKWPKLYVNKRIQAAKQFEPARPPHYLGIGAVALGFVLSLPGISATIPGAKTPEQVSENLAVADLPPLTPTERQAIEAVCDRLF